MTDLALRPSTNEDSNVPAFPSNRAFLEKLALWGCTPGRRKGNVTTMRSPDGTLFEVRLYQGNSEGTYRDAYAALGVTAEEFWSRGSKVRGERPRPAAKKKRAITLPKSGPVVVRYLNAAAEAEATARLIAFRDGKQMPRYQHAPPKRRTRHGQVLEWFKVRPGTAFDAATVAEDVDLDIQLVRLACAKLCRDGHLQRVTRGHYRLAGVDEDDVDRRLAEINAQLASTDDVLLRADLIQERIGLLNSTMSAPTVAVEASTVPVGATQSSSVPDGYDEEIDTLLDLLAPGGIRPHHEGAVVRWRSATRALIDQLQS